MSGGPPPHPARRTLGDRPGRSRRPAGPLSAAALSLLLAGCAADLGYLAPSFPFAARYEAAAGVPVLVSNELWWRRLGDPDLDRLVALALAGSPDLAAAEARLEAARAVLGTVGVAGGAEGGATALLDGEGEASLTLQASLSRVFDPGGALRAERRGALAGADIAQAELDAARLRLLAATVDGYLELRWRQQALALRQGELVRRRGTLAAARRLVATEAATRLDTLRAETRVAEAEADLPGLEAQAATALARLAVLAGRAPGGLPPDLARALSSGGPQPRATLAPEVGVPADLLRNRPDLRLAERRYYAAVAGIGAARAALYPRLSLRGSLSVDALSDGTASVAFGPSLQLPALPQGPVRAGVAAREAEAVAAAEDWRGAVLLALGEVEGALFEHRAAARSEEAARRAAALAGEALDLTRRLFELESVTVGEVIDAESALSQAEERLASLTLARARAFAALHVRLGAGNEGGDGGPNPA